MNDTQTASQTILITGSSTGIGKATAEYFHEQGWNVIATVRKPDPQDPFTQNERVIRPRLDVTDRASIDAAIQEGINAFGHIDVLLNNAGYGAVGVLEAASREELERQFSVNVFGVVECIQAILPHFRERHSGVIVNIASMGGRVTFPFYSLYHGTKWAVEGISESLQHELRSKNIKVKIVEPGAIKTNFYTSSMNLFSKDGLIAYDEDLDRSMPRMQHAGNSGTSPKNVAKVIYRAATDRRWKLRYPAAADAHMILLLRRLLPDTLFNWIVRRGVMR
jgi:NADP-dependent 3-hydroxy acid dehydrogenase YdfG